MMTSVSGKRALSACVALAVIAFVALVVTVLHTTAVQGGPAVSIDMLKDINPGAASSFPESLVDVDGVLFFSASDGVRGTELWRSDGSASGTQLVKDISPGTGNGVSGFDPAAAFKGALFFVADDGVNGFQPWRSDGTSQGAPCC